MGYDFLLNMVQGSEQMLIICTLVLYVLTAAGEWKMFEKAGEAGWKALIPVYNTYILYKISWNANMFWWNLLAECINVVLTVWGVLAMNNMMIYFAYAAGMVVTIIRAVLFYNVSLAYEHGIGYFIGLWLLQPIFVMILGFGGSRYAGNRYELEKM